MVVGTFSHGRQIPAPYNSMGKYGAHPSARKEDSPQRAKEVLQNGSSNGKAPDVSKNGNSHPTFRNAYAACNFIVTWNGEDVREVLDAIQCAREFGDRFIQDKLIEYILTIPFRNPRPSDIPAFVGKPVWAVDKQGRALVGMPGSETIVDVASLREQLHSNHQAPSAPLA